MDKVSKVKYYQHPALKSLQAIIVLELLLVIFTIMISPCFGGGGASAIAGSRSHGTRLPLKLRPEGPGGRASRSSGLFLCMLPSGLARSSLLSNAVVVPFAPAPCKC